jgi:hypothetical protein
MIQVGYKVIFSWFLFCFLPGLSLHSQLNCGGNVPSFNVNLTGQPNGVWTSPNVVRVGSCCGDNTCVGFSITLDPNSSGVSFSIISGAVPGGALSYQINCGGANTVGGPVCLSGIGPHYLTFCKVGNNANEYQIVSISKPVVPPSLTTNLGCSRSFNVQGVTPSSITWNSIFPGSSGQYNTNLNCASSCSTLVYTPPVSPPPFIDYVICGTPSSSCVGSNFCDTIRVFTNPLLQGNFQQDTMVVCGNGGTTTLLPQISGGTPPYQYLWNTGASTASITTGIGSYQVRVTDQTGCDI